MNLVITSATNPTVRHLKKLLSSAKARREHNQAVAEGVHLVRSFVQSDMVDTLVMYVVAESAQQNPEITELLSQLKRRQAPQVILADSLFTSLSAVHAAVGIAIVFAPPATSAASTPLTQNSLLLEDIQDPGNLGTILRTAAAVAIHDIYLSADSASPWSPKALRAGMGAQFGLHIYEQNDLTAIVQQAAIPTLATTLSHKSESLYTRDLSQPVAWILGNEGQGVSSQLTALATTHVRIPQTDTPVIESLNVATAAAVCLYEQYRQRHL